MHEAARKVLRMRDPERLFVIALSLSSYADKEGHLREAPLKLLQELFYPTRNPYRDTGPAARLVMLMRQANYLENRNPKGNRGDWVLHLPPGVQSLAGHEVAVQMQLVTDVTTLVQRHGNEKIPTIVAILRSLQRM